jgi:hypothetical protein
VDVLLSSPWTLVIPPYVFLSNEKDAALVMHLFFKFLAEKMPNSALIDKYFCELDTTPPGSILQIRVAQKSPLHFQVCLDNGCVWDVHPGRNNMFQALVLFAWNISKKNGGYRMS